MPKCDCCLSEVRRTRTFYTSWPPEETPAETQPNLCATCFETAFDIAAQIRKKSGLIGYTMAMRLPVFNVSLDDLGEIQIIDKKKSPDDIGGATA
jgi:hypothetical protein